MGNEKVKIKNGAQEALKQDDQRVELFFFNFYNILNEGKWKK